MPEASIDAWLGEPRFHPHRRQGGEGAILASGPVITVEQQADGALTKAPGLAYVQAYEAKFGKETRTQFGAHVWDAVKVLERIVPVALKTASPARRSFVRPCAWRC